MYRPDRADTAAISNIDVKTRARCIDDAEQCNNLGLDALVARAPWKDAD